MKYVIVVMAIVLGLSLPSVATIYSEGDTMANFTLPLRGTSTNVSLYDYAGQIVVLDFFAYWCGPCRTASAELEPYIQQYYRDLGGNPAGIEVSLISLNIESANPALTEDYINDYGLETVLDDFNRDVYNTFGNNGIPQFAIINGVAGANYGQWEIINNQLGYASGMYNSFRTDIDSVVPEPCSLVLLSLGGLMLRRKFSR